MRALLFLLPLLFIGCSTKEQVYIDRPIEIKVPIKCEIPQIEKPIYNKGYNIKLFLIDIKEYEDKLIEAIEVCK